VIRRLWIALLAGLVATAGAGETRAQNPQIEFKRTNLAKGVYMLRAIGGNVGVITGPDGVLLVDAQVAEVGAKLEFEIQRLTTQPVRFIVNTHWHQDHSGGNLPLVAKGAVVMAHHNTRARMGESQFLEVFNKHVPASQPEALPTVTFADDTAFHLNGEEIRAVHTPAAHTDGDVMVHFKNANVLVTGDVYFNGMYPYIDLASGGSIEGLIAATGKALELADDETKVVPGHGLVSDRAGLAAYHEMLTTVRDRVAEQIAAGKVIGEVREAGLTSDLDERWGHGFIRADAFIDIVFSSLSSE
jgi:glyoxylase-like metal-dependent hydrolase (beta-lactamase superfamily II)